jgi:hypothetical protein
VQRRRVSLEDQHRLTGRRWGRRTGPPALSRVNKRALMLAKGGALALVTSGVVRLKLPNEKEPKQVFVGAMPADAAAR